MREQETEEGRLVSDAAGIVQLFGRILFGGYFVFTGAGFHIPKTRMAEEYARSMRFPVPQVAGWPTGVWMVAGGLSIALGIWADIGALMIAAFAVPAAAWFHRFWEVEDPMQRQFQQGYFGRNVIIVGACLVMFAFFVAAGDSLRYAITSPAFSF
jgi:putative oxidoreductase